MISALVSSLFIDNGKPDILKKCLDSIVGADEILSLVTHINKPLGFCDAWNRLATISKGDYLVFIGDNNFLTRGSLKDLAILDTVTSPLINELSSDFWGSVFCMPRDIYEKHGLYDMAFNDGIHYMDEDLKMRLKSLNISTISVGEVNFSHPQGGRTINIQENFNSKVQRNFSIYKNRWQGR